MAAAVVPVAVVPKRNAKDVRAVSTKNNNNSNNVITHQANTKAQLNFSLSVSHSKFSVNSNVCFNLMSFLSCMFLFDGQ